MSFREIKIKTLAALSSMEQNIFLLKKEYLSLSSLVNTLAYVSYLFYQEPIKICFLSTDGTEKEVSFDFYEINDPIRKMIDKKDINLVQSALT